MKSGLSLIFCIALAAGIGSALAFALSSGFFSAGRDGPFACRDLMSSGSDDQLAMVYFAALLPSLVYRIARWRHPMRGFEPILLGGSLVLASAAIATSLDCGGFFYTAFGVGDPYLVVVIASLSIAIIASLLLAVKSISGRP